MQGTGRDRRGGAVIAGDSARIVGNDQWERWERTKPNCPLS